MEQISCLVAHVQLYESKGSTLTHKKKQNLYPYVVIKCTMYF